MEYPQPHKVVFAGDAAQKPDCRPPCPEIPSLHHPDVDAVLSEERKPYHCVFRSIRSRIGIEVRSAIRIHSINRELNFFYRFLTRFFAAFH
ncbi:hypothetical protein, partial [Escherichia coli]|uniref:hypothetical protein n=1 Tax=Escherichia coli TaxID=562 RepID=UPI00201E608F